MSEKTVPFVGSCVALITPFKNGTIDIEQLNRLIDFHLEHRTDALLICGTTGESATLTDSERTLIIRSTVERVNHRIPVIVGTGSNSTDAAVRLSKQAESLGADALLLITPFYNKTSQAGLIKHFEVIAGSIHLPCILYNVPSRTGMTIQLDTYAELSSIPNIVATKEASGSAEYASQIVQRCESNLIVYSGNDDLNVEMMQAGAKGTVSVLSNVLPEEVHQIIFDCLNGCYEAAYSRQNEYQEMTAALFMEVNPIPVKYALQRMQLCSGDLRLPLVELSQTQKEKMDLILQSYHLLPSI